MQATNGVKDFFPALYSAPSSNSFMASLLSFLFPESTHIPALHLKVLGSNRICIKRPLVAAAALTGSFLFQGAGRKLLRLSFSKSQFRGAFSWGVAMLWYSIMCIGAVWYDSISHHPFFYNLDIVGTACCSVSAIAGSVGVDDRTPANRRVLVSAYLLAMVVVSSTGSQLVKELMYVIPALLALFAGVFFCWNNGRNEEGEKEWNKKEANDIRKWKLVAGLGGVLALGGLVFSRWIKLVLGQHFCEVFSFFLGSNLALWGLFRLVVASNRAGFQVFLS